jgi:hypothetical protein
LARAVKEVIEHNRAALGAPVDVPVLRGRDHEGEKGGAPCRRWREARALGRKGLPVYSNLCRRSHRGEVSECPHFADCEYIRAWRAAHAAPFVIPCSLASWRRLGWHRYCARRRRFRQRYTAL